MSFSAALFLPHNALLTYLYDPGLPLLLDLLHSIPIVASY